MITVSNEIKNMLESEARDIDMRIVNASDDSVVDCSIKNITVHKGACGEFQVGSIYVPYVDITLDYEVTLPSEIIIQCGAKVGDSYSYFDVGHFFPVTSKKNLYSTEINCQGVLSKTVSDLLYATEPTARTLNDILTAIRNKGYIVTLNNIVLPSGDVEGALLGLSVRDALQIIATCVGGFVTEDNNGGIVISKFNPCTTADMDLDGNRSINVPDFKGEYEVTGCKVVVDEETVYEETPNNVVIENPYFTSDMWNTFKGNLTGLTFESGSFSVSLGDPRLEPWDCVRITDGSPAYDWERLDGGSWGNINETNWGELASPIYHYMPCFNLTFDYDGALKMDIEADVQLDEEKEVFTGGVITKKLTELNHDVERAFDEISEASKTATNYLKYVPQSGLYVTDDTETLDNAVKIDSDSIDFVAGGQEVTSMKADSISMCKGKAVISYIDGTDEETGRGDIVMITNEASQASEKSKEITISTEPYMGTYPVSWIQASAQDDENDMRARLWLYTQYSEDSRVASIAIDNLGTSDREYLMSIITLSADQIFLNGNRVYVSGSQQMSPIVSMETLNKIFGTSYSLSLRITNGTFTNNGTTAYLLGNTVRLYINCTAKSAKTAGNITNETMMTIKFTQSKIKGIWNVSNSGGTNGPNSQISLSCSSDGTEHTITVNLCALAQNLAKDGAINSYIAIPCTLNLDAF